MLNKSLQFLSEHKEVAFATCGGNLPKLRMFQVMKQDGNVLYFATSAKKTVYRELKENPNVELLAYADSYDQLEYFCLPIADLDYFDLSPTPPVNQHFDLMAGEIDNGFVGERFCK